MSQKQHTNPDGTTRAAGWNDREHTFAQIAAKWRQMRLSK